MPLILSDLGRKQGLNGQVIVKHVETFFTPAFEKDFLRDLILDKERIWVKLNKCIIVSYKFMNLKQVSIDFGNM